MSQKLVAQAQLNGLFELVEIPGLGNVFAGGTTVPTDGVPGFGKSALFVDMDATAGTGWYINRGTITSANFDPLLGGIDLSTLTATAAELNTLHSQTWTTGAGAGITGGTGTIYKNSLQLSGGIYLGRIMIDLTGLGSSTTDLDVIGQGASAAYIGRYLTAELGTLLEIRMTCLEAPAGGVTDIDLYSATEGTAVFDDGIAALTETALITAGGAWTNGATKGATVMPAASEYLYLTGGAGGTAGTYTAGKFLLEFYGY